MKRYPYFIAKNWLYCAFSDKVLADLPYRDNCGNLKFLRKKNNDILIPEYNRYHWKSEMQFFLWFEVSLEIMIKVHLTFETVI